MSKLWSLALPYHSHLLCIVTSYHFTIIISEQQQAETNLVCLSYFCVLQVFIRQIDLFCQAELLNGPCVARGSLLDEITYSPSKCKQMNYLGS